MTVDNKVCWIVNFSAEIVFFLFKVGESLLEPTIRLFIYQGVCDEHTSNLSACQHLRLYPFTEEQVQAIAAQDIMIYKILLNVPAIIMALFCGAWSDRIGRKLPVMLPCFGTIIAVMFYMLAMTVHNSPFLQFVMVGATIRGIFGKSAIVTMALYSYVADTSDTEERTERLGRLLAMNFFGYFVGSLTAGLLLDITSFHLLFSIVVIFYSSCIVIALTCMRESVQLNPTTRVPNKQLESSCICSVTHVKESLAVLVKPRENRTRCHLMLLFSVILFNQMCKSGEVDVTLLYVENTPLNWRKSMYGYLLATDYGCLGIAGLCILPTLIHFVKLQDTTLVMIGIVFKIIRLLLLFFSSTTWMVYLSVVLGCPSAMIVSGVKSLVSKLIDVNDMGKAFSLISCGETVANLVGSILFINVYSATLEILPGFVFAVDVMFFVCLFGVVVLLTQDMNAIWQYNLLKGDSKSEISDEEKETLFAKRTRTTLQPIQEISE